MLRIANGLKYHLFEAGFLAHMQHRTSITNIDKLMMFR
jgi:hypothetical protein